eukprot:6735349-Lingulodinium_polyedra.AAC.1
MDPTQTGHGLRCRRSACSVSGLFPCVQTDACPHQNGDFARGVCPFSYGYSVGTLTGRRRG